MSEPRSTPPPSPRARPNVVVVMTDDQGWWARQDHTPELITPAMLRLVDRGRDFTRAFCASPVCSPARASILTGRMPSAHGVHDWLRATPGDPPYDYLDGAVTTPMMLSDAGYRCGHVGKWHLGHAQHPAPGFTDWAMVHRAGGGPYLGAPVWVDGQAVTAPGYVTDRITDAAVDTLASMLAGPDPFYLQVHYTAPHTPWGAEHHPPERLAPYQDRPVTSLPVEPVHPWFDRSAGDLGRASDDPAWGIRGFAAALTAADEGLGRLLDLLDAHDRGRETYVIFLSDNGFSCGHHGIWGKGNATRPLNMLEESVRVPLIVAGPGVVTGEDPTMISTAGLHATIVDLAGVELPPDPLRAAPSFAGLLGGHSPHAERYVAVYDEYGGTRMIRSERWKYVVRHAGPAELYDLLSDPGERVDLIDHPDQRSRRAELDAELARWFAGHSLTERDAYRRPVGGGGQRTPVWTDHPDELRYAP